MGDYFSSGNLIRLITKWKFHLAVIVIVAALASAFFSGEMFIRPKYRSTAVLYPTNLNPYGDESPTEQMLQLLQSNDIRNHIFKKFGMAKHYGIDTNYRGYYSMLVAEFNENVSIRKTEYESVKIDVMDTHADTACAIVKEYILALDLKARELQREKFKEVADLYGKLLLEKKAEIDTMEARLKELRVTYGILHYEAQAKELTKKYLNSKGGDKAGANDVIAMIRNLEEKGGEFVAIESNLKKERIAYNNIKGQYEENLKHLNKELTYSSTVVRPVPADKKSYPVRWIIVAIYTAATFFLALIVIAYIDRKKQGAVKTEGRKEEVYELQEVS
jgi:hypothetical protein